MGIRRDSARAAGVLAAAILGCAGQMRGAGGTMLPANAPATTTTTTTATTTATTTGASEAQAAERGATVGPEAIAKQAFEEGLRLEQSADLSGAAASFERAYDASPDLAHAGVNAALLRERLGDEAGARALYARILDKEPGFAPAVRSLVRLSIRAGDVAGAEKEARARLERGPDGAALHNALADALLAAGRLGEAEEESRKALKLDERNVAAMVNLATAYHRKKRNELAKMVLENARAIDGRDPTVWNRLGLLELAAGNRAQALEDFRTAAALAPDYPEARANHGALLADAEDFQGAATELEAAVKYAPRNSAAWLDLGNAYRGTQRFEKAEAAYRKALELEPSLVDVQFNLAVLYLDGDKPGMPALARLEQSVAFFDAFEQKGGAEAKIAEYRKDAGKAIEREKKRLAREERDRLRREAEAKKKEEEARKEAELAAAQKAEEERKAAEAAAREPAADPTAATTKATTAIASPSTSPSTSTTTSTSTSTSATPTPNATTTAPAPAPAPAVAGSAAAVREPAAASSGPPPSAAPPSLEPSAASSKPSKTGEERGDR